MPLAKCVKAVRQVYAERIAADKAAHSSVRQPAANRRGTDAGAMSSPAAPGSVSRVPAGAAASGAPAGAEGGIGDPRGTMFRWRVISRPRASPPPSTPPLQPGGGTASAQRSGNATGSAGGSGGFFDEVSTMADTAAAAVLRELLVVGEDTVPDLEVERGEPLAEFLYNSFVHKVRATLRRAITRARARCAQRLPVPQYGLRRLAERNLVRLLNTVSRFQVCCAAQRGAQARVTDPRTLACCRAAAQDTSPALRLFARCVGTRDAVPPDALSVCLDAATVLGKLTVRMRGGRGWQRCTRLTRRSGAQHGANTVEDTKTGALLVSTARASACAVELFGASEHHPAHGPARRVSCALTCTLRQATPRCSTPPRRRR